MTEKSNSMQSSIAAHSNDQTAFKGMDFRKSIYIGFKHLLIIQRSPYILFISIPTYGMVDEETEK